MLLDSLLWCFAILIMGIVVLLVCWLGWRLTRSAIFIAGLPWRSWRLSSGWLMRRTLEGLTTQREDPTTWRLTHGNLSATLRFADARVRGPGSHELSLEVDLGDRLPASLRFESSLGFQRLHYLGDRDFDASFVCIQGVDVGLALLSDTLRQRLTHLRDVPEYIGWHHLSLRDGRFRAHIPMSAMDPGVTAHKLRTLLGETLRWCQDAHTRMASSVPYLLREGFQSDPEPLWRRHCLLSLLTDHHDHPCARDAFHEALDCPDIRQRVLCLQHASEWMTPEQRHNVQVHAILELPTPGLRRRIGLEVLEERGLQILQDPELPLLARVKLLDIALARHPIDVLLPIIDPLIEDAAPWDRALWLHSLHHGRAQLPHPWLARWLAETQGDDLAELLALTRLHFHASLEPSLQDLLSWASAPRALEILELLADQGSPRVTGFVDRLSKDPSFAHLKRPALEALATLRARHAHVADGALTLGHDLPSQHGELTLERTAGSLTSLEEVVLDLEPAELYVRTSQPHSGLP